MYISSRNSQTHTHFTHMHASHTTWLINSNLNVRGLTSYTHAFWWCLEKTLQYPQWVRQIGRQTDWSIVMNMKVKKNFKSELMRSRQTPEWQLGVVAKSWAAGNFATGSPEVVEFNFFKLLIPRNTSKQHTIGTQPGLVMIFDAIAEINPTMSG